MDWTMGPADTWDALAAFLRSSDDIVGRKPDAIVVVSGHHEADPVEITTSAAPPMLFDYYGFPAHTYRLSYPAPGSPQLAARIGELLDHAEIAHRADPERGFDHGVFVPMLLMYPHADIPIVQLSLHSNLDARFHVRLGQAIAPLRDEGVLLLGSGMTYHNMRRFGHPSTLPESIEFDTWLTHTCTADATRRNELLPDWADAPSARLAHPREEHLLPLMVIAGAAATDKGQRIFADTVMGARISAYRFGEPSPDPSQRRGRLRSRVPASGTAPR